MEFKRGDKVKIRKDVTLEEISNNYFNGCQMDTMKFLLKASFDKFEGTFIVKEAISDDGCVRLNNSFIVNVVVLDKVKEILDEKEKEYLRGVIKPFRDRITYINLENLYNRTDAVYIIVHIKNNDSMILPTFKKGTMYKNMKVNEKYTLRELGL